MNFGHRGIKPLFFCLLLWSCGTINKPPTSPRSIPKGIVFKKLRALDLSEDMSRLSSKNDELLLIINLVQTQPTNRILPNKIIYDKLLLDTTTTVVMLGDTLHFPSQLDDLGLSILLIELDETNSIQQNISAAQQLLSIMDFSKPIQNRLDYNRIFADDDLLGFDFFSIKKILKNTIYTHKIEGISLIDKYDYRLVWELIY